MNFKRFILGTLFYSTVAIFIIICIASVSASCQTKVGAVLNADGYSELYITVDAKDVYAKTIPMTINSISAKKDYDFDINGHKAQLRYKKPAEGKGVYTATFGHKVILTTTTIKMAKSALIVAYYEKITGTKMNQ